MSDERFLVEERTKPRDIVMGLVELTCRKFRYTPARKYLESVVDEFLKRLTIAEIGQVLDKLPLRYEAFPAMQFVEQEIKTFERERWVRSTTDKGTIIRKASKVWVSEQAPGTPAQFEAIFEMIFEKKSDTGAFRFARSVGRQGRMSDEDLWECYESWCQGKVNPKVFQEPPQKAEELSHAHSL